MSNIQIFNYNSVEVRTIQNDGEPWFVLKDVCNVLHIGNSRDVVARLDQDEKGVGQIDTLGGKQEMTIINESGPCNKERMLRFGTSFLWGSGKTGGTLFSFRVKNFMKCHQYFIGPLLRSVSSCGTLFLTRISSAIAWGNCTPLERS